MTIIFVILACLGLTFILKYGTILDIPRVFLCKVSVLRDLFKCSLCLGFWSGVIIGYICYIYNILGDLIILLPLVSSACCWIGDNINNVIQSVEIKLDNENDR